MSRRTQLRLRARDDIIQLVMACIHLMKKSQTNFDSRLVLPLAISIHVPSDAKEKPDAQGSCPKEPETEDPGLKEFNIQPR